MKYKHCNHCHKKITKDPNDSYRYWMEKKFCSMRCYGLSKRGKSMEELIGKETARKIIEVNRERCRNKEISPKNRVNNLDKFARKGNVPWNKGLTKDDSRVLKYVLKRNLWFKDHNPWKGKKRPEHSIRMSGKNHWNWQGGINPKNDSLRKSYLFKDWAKEVKNVWNYECQICGTHHGPLHSNHIKRFSDYENLRYELKNGIVLCKSCHEKMVNNHENEWESYFNFCWENRLLT